MVFIFLQFNDIKYLVKLVKLILFNECKVLTVLREYLSNILDIFEDVFVTMLWSSVPVSSTVDLVLSSNKVLAPWIKNLLNKVALSC